MNRTVNDLASTKNLDEVKVNQRITYLIFKRIIDVSLSLAAIIFLSPLLITVYTLIKIGDPKNPAIFKQTRVGKDLRHFTMYKFRSMEIDAELKLKSLLESNEVSGHMFKMKDDPRVTKLGKFIRKTSIDELPQLFNVLIGNMSLVGPRPPLINEVEHYSDFHKQRLLVLPGCTGLWQCTSRNTVGFDNMVLLDLEYISKRSIFFDIKIIFKTILVMLKSEAY